MIGVVQGGNSVRSQGWYTEMGLSHFFVGGAGRKRSDCVIKITFCEVQCEITYKEKYRVLELFRGRISQTVRYTWCLKDEDSVLVKTDPTYI